MSSVVLYSLVYLILFGFTELLYHKLRVNAYTTRKVVHIGTGLIALTFPVYLDAFWQVLILCLSFLVLMALSERFNWFKSITDVSRKSYGSWLFALVVLICFYVQSALQSPVYYFLPLLILTISDPLAASVGKKFQFVPIHVFGAHKTLGGSLAFLISSLTLICSFAYFYQTDWMWWQMMSFALVVSVVELMSVKGWDNLTIPLSAIGLMYLFS